MKTTLTAIGASTLTRMAKKLGAQIRFEKRINYEEVCGWDVDVYLWDWGFGFIKITDPVNLIGLAIMSVITKDETESRNETPRFSHVCIHDKQIDFLNVYTIINGVNDVTEWYEEFVLSNPGLYRFRVIVPVSIG